MQKQKIYRQDLFAALERIPILKNPKNILLVTMPDLPEKIGVAPWLFNFLHQHNLFIFDQVQENAPLNEIKKGITLSRQKKINLILALGGGSVLDSAKAISIFLTNKSDPLSYIKQKNKITNPGLPIIAIPTTAGTGSEATKYSVINYQEKGQTIKKTLEHHYLIPESVILDPKTTFSLNPYHTAITGLDALSHAIESHWSIYSTSASRRLARQAIELILKNLQKAASSPKDYAPRAAMLEASNKAGQAINITKTTIAHSASYPLTINYKIPHGLACGLTLANFFIFNSKTKKENCQDKRGHIFVLQRMRELTKLFGVKSPEAAAEKINRLMQDLKLKIRLSDYNIKNINLILEQGFTPERALNNPRKVSKNDLKNILQKIK